LTQEKDALCSDAKIGIKDPPSLLGYMNESNTKQFSKCAV